MIRKKYKKRNKQQNIIANHRIRYPKVRVLGEDGKMIDIMPTKQALTLAFDQGKDLVLITDKSDIPVVKIIDLSKYKYEQKRRASELRKKQKVQKVKEIKSKIFIQDADLEHKLRKARTFLEKGHKVKINLDLRRAHRRKEGGYELASRFIKNLEDIAKVEQQPKLIRSSIITLLAPLIGKQKNEKKQDKN